MPSLSIRESARPAESPTRSLELAIRPRRHSHRWAIRAAGGLLALLVLAFVLPLVFGLSRYTVTDDAMGGTLGPGTAVFAKALPIADLEVGDVITYRHPSTSEGALITRRIADITGGVIRTRGDRTGALDPWTLTSERSTQARVVLHIPYVGHVYDAFTGPAGLLWTKLTELR